MTWRILNMADTAPCPRVFDALEPFARVVSLPAGQDVLTERIGEFDGYVASLHVRVDQHVLAHAPRLRVIATPSTGLDHLAMDDIQQRGIVVLSLKEKTDFLDSVTATAEMAWALLLAVVRRLPWSFAAATSGVWARDRYRGHQLSGKTLGVLGYGRLGRMVADYGKAFRMRVLACDVRSAPMAPGVERVSFDRLIRESDVLSLHVHLSEETRGMVGSDVLQRMKPGAVLVNTSRGALIDEQALVRALESGPLAGAGLDVIDGEWNRDVKNHILIRYARDHENLVISPHTGGVTEESQAMALAFTVGKLRRFLESSAPQ